MTALDRANLALEIVEHAWSADHIEHALLEAEIGGLAKTAEIADGVAKLGIWYAIEKIRHEMARVKGER